MTYKETFKPFLSSLFDSVMKQAMEDDILSPEESLLLSQIEIDIRSFEKEMAKCLEEDEITIKLNAKIFEEKLINNVKKLALEDGIISQDEEAILDKLEEYFNKLNTLDEKSSYVMS